MFLRNELEILKDIAGEDSYLFKLAKREHCQHNIISKTKGDPNYVCEECAQTSPTVEAFYGHK